VYRIILFFIFTFPIYQSPLGNTGVLITLGLSFMLYALHVTSIKLKKIDLYLALFIFFELILYVINYDSASFLHTLRSILYVFLIHIFIHIRKKNLTYSIKVYLISIVLISFATIIANLASLLGIDMLFFTKIARYFEYISLADHPSIGRILDEEFLDRLTWGNPTDFALMLFVGIVLFLETDIIDNKWKKGTLLVIYIALMFSLSRTFIAASLVYVLFKTDRVRLNRMYKHLKALFLFSVLLIFGYFIFRNYSDVLRVDNIINFETGVRFRMHEIFIDNIDNYLFIGSGHGWFSNILFNEFGYKTTAESLYLTIGSQYGILFSAVFIVILVKVIKTSKAISSILILLLLGIGVLVPISSYILFYIFIGIMHSANSHHLIKQSQVKK